MNLKVLMDLLSDLLDARPIVLGSLALGVLLGVLFHLFWRSQQTKRSAKHLCHPSEHDKLLEYMYDGSPLSSNVYSGPSQNQCPERAHGGDVQAPALNMKPFLNEEELELATAMLKLAKQSYERCNGKEGYRTQNIAGLPCITIFKEDLLKTLFRGVIKLRLHCANNLQPVSLLQGYARPYVEAFVAASSFRTDISTHGSLINPSWDEDHWLYIRDPQFDSLSIRVLGDTAFARGINLGTSVLGLGGLVENPGRAMDFKLPLRGFASENSSVTITCAFYSFPLEVSEVPDKGPLHELKKYQALQRLEKCRGCNTKPTINDMGIPECGLLPVAYVDCGATDTQAWVFANGEQRKLVVAFRGTEPKLADIITDARFILCSFETIIQGDDTRAAARQDVRVHRGFMRAYRSVRRILSSLVYEITKTRPTKGSANGNEQVAEEQGSGIQVDGGQVDQDYSWVIHITGHSLGGALATLAAYELGIYREYAGNISNVTLHTFGSPRVGDARFAEQFDKNVPDTWRFTNCADIVPTVPPASLFTYQHVGRPVRLRGKGQALRGLTGGEEKEARRSLKERKDTLGQGGLRLDVQREWTLLASAVKRGVRDHGTEQYIDNLPKTRAPLSSQEV